MKILAIDSTAKTVAAALCEDGTLCGEITLNAKNTHSETLLPAVEQLLATFSVSPASIGLYALTRGPGSFTGVRIGAATVKGLAFTATGEEPVPVAAVSTLEALAYNFEGIYGEAAPVLAVPVMDARRAQVYTARFSVTGGAVVRESPDAALSLEALAAELETAAAGRRVLFCGDGYRLAQDFFAARPHGFALCPTPEALRYPRGLSIARCGLAAFARGEQITAAALVPLYLRGSQADEGKGTK